MIRVLVADDDSALLQILSKFIQSTYHAEVKTAKDGREALKVLKDFEADLLILDHMMPRANGLKVIEEVRAQYKENGRQLPKVLVYSAFNISREARAAGADGFLQKPGSVDKLKAEIDRLVPGQ